MLPTKEELHYKKHIQIYSLEHDSIESWAPSGVKSLCFSGIEMNANFYLQSGVILPQIYYINFFRI